WDVTARVEALDLAGDHGGVVAAVFRADGTRLLTAHLDGTEVTWDPRTGREVDAGRPPAPPVPGLAVSPDGARSVVAGADGAIRVRDLRSGADGPTLAGAVAAAAFSRDGARVATAGRDGAAKVWDPAT